VSVGGRAAPRLLGAQWLGATALSLPWPGLLAQVFARTGSDGWVGLAGAGRLLPYVALSALAGMLADRVDRSAVLRWSAGARTALLAGCALALVADHLAAAVVLAVLAVAAGTPAYPAAVAALPRLAPQRTERWTTWLVTAEVTSFVVGPAVGGVLLGAGLGRWSLPVAVVLGATSFGLLAGLGPAPVPGPFGEGRSGSGRRHRLRAVLAVPGVPGVIGLVALVNFVDSAAAVALLRLSADHWHAGDRGFGVATAALGLGSLAAPLLRRALALRGSLRVTGAGLLLTGVVPGAAAAVAPLALAGAGSTVVECVVTETLQRRVPDRFRAFSLGLTDSVMVAAAAVGALVGPGLVSLVGPVPTFGTLGLLLAVAALRPSPLPRWRRNRPVRLSKGRAG
jgi:MFS family permease